METDSLVERLAPDREMAEPSYLQLARKLSWLIESGEIPHGQRVRLGDGAPLSREVAWYDLTAAPDLAEWDVVGSAYQFLYERCGIALTRGEQTIEAVMSSEAETEVFEFAEPGPCLLMKRKTYSVAGQMIEYVEGTFRGGCLRVPPDAQPGTAVAVKASTAARLSKPSRMPSRAAMSVPEALPMRKNLFTTF